MAATISTDTAVTGSGRRPSVTSVPAQTPAQVESNSVTLSEMAADPQVQSTLDYYEYDKNKEFSNSYEESLKNFLSDFRFLQNNTYGTASFINYVGGIEDREYLINLGVLYDKVDAELESQMTPFNEGASIGDVAVGAAEYAGYNIVDPINMLGGLVGKTIASRIGRPLIKTGVKKAFTSRLKRMGTAAGVAASIEGPLAAGANVLLQEAEIDIEAREEISAAEVALSGGFGAVLGGLTGAAFSAPDPFKHSQKIIDAMASSPQAKASKQSSLADVGSAGTVSRENINPAQPAVTPNSVQGLYVTISKDTPEGYDPMGRVVGARSDEVDIEFLSLKPGDLTRNSRLIQTVKLKDAKALSAEEVEKRVKEYIDTSGRFFDRTSIKEADRASALTAKRLKELGVNPESFSEVNKIVLDPAFAERFNRIIRELDVGVQKDLSKHVDLRANPTEQMASKIANVQMGLLPKTLTDLLTKEGMTLKEFASFYRASISKFGVGLANQRGLPIKEMDDIAVRAGKDLAPSEEAAYITAQKHAQKDSKVNASWVDLWRSFIVSQPATTQRNILGSLARAPGVAFRSKIDQLMVRWERQLQGLPKDVEAERIIKEANSIDFVNRLINPSDSIRTMEIFANSNPEVKVALKSTFDDHLAVDASEASGLILRGGYRVSKFVNTLNRMQDRAIKSSAFLAEMDNQIRRARSTGLFKNTNIKTFEDVLATSGDPSTSKLDLITNEMVAKSLKAAYEATYQARNAGDKLLVGGNLINWLQDSLNSSKAAQIKWFIPFPNFMINSFVYTINRAVIPAPLIKIGVYGEKVGRRVFSKKGRKEAIEKRDRLTFLREESKQTEAVEKEIEELRGFFGKAEAEARTFKDGIQEFVESSAFFGVAYAIRSSELAGEKWDEVKTSDDEYFSMKPLFPLAPYLLLADMFIRQRDDVPQQKGILLELVTMLTGLEGRGGMLGQWAPKIINHWEKSASPSLDWFTFKASGSAIGGLFGEILGGFATPLRAIGDLNPPKEKLDMRQQTDLLVKQGVFTKGEIETDNSTAFLSSAFDEAAKAILRGTPFEDSLLDTSAVKHSSLTSETVKRAPVPFIKQVTGTAALSPTGPVEKEFNRLGLLPYKMTKYSEVPEYRDMVEKELGRLTTLIVEPMLINRTYLARSDVEKQRFLTELYKGGGAKDKLGTKGSDTVPLITQASNTIKEKFSRLYAFHRFKSKNNSADEDAVRDVLIKRDPEEARRIYDNLKYLGEGVAGQGLDNSLEILNKELDILEDRRQNAMSAIAHGLPKSTGGLMGRP